MKYPSMFKIVFIVLVSFCFCQLSFGQDSIAVPNVVERELKLPAEKIVFTKPNLFKSLGKIPDDMWYMAKAPFKKDNIVGVGAVVGSSILLVALDQKISNGVRNISDKIALNPEENYDVPFAPGGVRIIKVPQNLNSLFYQFGEGGTSMLLAGGLWIYGKAKHDYRATSTASDLTETFVAMGVTTQILKRITGRQSPSAATTNGGLWRPFPAFKNYQQNTSSYDAFPSGHLATMMATVTVLAYNYPEKKWVKPVGYSVMGLTAWAMINAKVHWIGDYPLAIAIGYLAGKVTTMRHKNSIKKIVKLPV
jgi:membrane-associated phospholipid phosphatase